jgi:hypothetical protein
MREAVGVVVPIPTFWATAFATNDSTRRIITGVFILMDLLFLFIFSTAYLFFQGPYSTKKLFMPGVLKRQKDPVKVGCVNAKNYPVKR